MSEIDIVPGLLEQVQKEFKRLFQSDPTVKRIYEQIKKNAVEYAEANKFAIRVGEILSEALRKYITVDTLPDGIMYYNIASRIMEPTLRTNYNLIVDVCKYAQQNVNSKSKIGLKVITPEINQDKVDGFADVLSSDAFEKTQYMLGEPVVNYSQSVVDDSIRENVEFHAKSGLSPKIIRRLDTTENRMIMRGKTKVKYQVPCTWCLSLAGTYDYLDMPDYIADNIFRRHEYCRCTVEYVDAEENYKQDVWSKKIYDINKADRIALNNQTTQSETAEERIARLG